MFARITSTGPGGEETVDSFIEAGKRDISTTFFISSYFSPTFPVVACDSRHCVKQNAKQNVKIPPPQSVPLGARVSIAPPLLCH